jgi:adenosylcobinamide-GDP ribazoletransferase
MQTNPMHGLLSAFRTLTILSWPGKENNDLSASLPWFPVVGAILGLMLYGLARMGMFFSLNPWYGGLAIIILTVGVWLTRGLHLDGLADWADSIGGSYSREKRLAIMKDSHTGAFGVIVLVLVLLAKWVAFERLLLSGTMIWVLITMIISRDMMVELITTLPYARSGDGMGRPFVEGASLRHRIISHILCLLFCLPFGLLAFVLWGVAMVITRIFRKVFLKGFGGITGDLLGTTNEMIEVILFIMCALSGPILKSHIGWTWVS